MAAGNAQGGRWLLTASIAFNGLFLGVSLVLGVIVWLSEPLWAGLFPRAELAEIVRPESGSGREKVAIIRVEGVLAEGLLGYVHRQIEQAAADKGVQAVVLRVNSPGGTITSSDDLHRRLTALISGDPAKKRDPKPLVASFGSLAASGGYYISAPAATIVCDRSGLTGSIGVFAGLPSIEGFSKQHGVGMTVIKQGEIKDSGSMFRSMTPKERQVWQDLIDTSYNRFVAVVEEGRGKRLKRKLLEPFPVAPVRAGPNPPEVQPYQRYLAAGGIYTAARWWNTTGPGPRRNWPWASGCQRRCRRLSAPGCGHWPQAMRPRHGWPLPRRVRDDTENALYKPRPEVPPTRVKRSDTY